MKLYATDMVNVSRRLFIVRRNVPYVSHAESTMLCDVFYHVTGSRVRRRHLHSTCLSVRDLSVWVLAAAVAVAARMYVCRSTLGAREESRELNAAPASNHRSFPSYSSKVAGKYEKMLYFTFI